jgi:hypothetical protein
LHCAVMPGLVPGIHAFLRCRTFLKGVDGRDKPGHDVDGVEVPAWPSSR